ncbi:MAG: hypothetical protein A2066_02745 [Bacteroidetes bacterium GWB2_41_8]|nr:MAG: hypothetical protein A2066_02745 [Bacteroidetes bacterium GWB2_41_8]
MIKARHNALSFWFFRTFYTLRRKMHFRKMTIVSGVDVPENLSVLLLQNHFSWWDGYWSYWLSRNIFRRKFHVMMDEQNLLKHMFLNRIGVFSVQKNSRDLLNSLAYSSDLLKDPKNLLTIYPTGAMLSQHEQIVTFQRGTDKIIKGEPKDFSIVLAVFLIDYFGFARPEIRIYLEKYSGERTGEALEKAYREFYQSCIAKQTE